MEKHKRLAFWAIGEAVANLVLSVILVRKIGIYGVAWGTAIPSIFIELLLGPVSKLVEIPVTFPAETWVMAIPSRVPWPSVTGRRITCSYFF